MDLDAGSDTHWGPDCGSDLSPGSARPRSSTRDPDLGLDSDPTPDCRADPTRGGDSDPDPGPYLSSGLGLGTPISAWCGPGPGPRRGPPHGASAPDSGCRPELRPRTSASSRCRPEPRLTWTGPQAQTSGRAPRRPPGPELMPIGARRGPCFGSSPADSALRTALGLPGGGAWRPPCLRSWCGPPGPADRPADPRQETNSGTASRQRSACFWSAERPRAAIMATWVPVMG